MSDPTVSPAVQPDPASAEADPERDAIVSSESVLLDSTLEILGKATRRIVQSYDQELLALRDQIAEARQEDLPPLVQQMERLQQISIRRAEVPTGKVEPHSPYFGHLKLAENGRTRDVLIGNASYIDTERGLRIVDWRDAPVSRLYYRYSEGDEYEEEFGGRTLEGTIAVRRSVVISDALLRRIMSPQGTFVRQGIGVQTTWRRITTTLSRLAGGQGTAERAPALEEYSVRGGRLGVRIAGREDRHLPEIPALIDRRQFELISKPGSGLVVIQGGAGSGKTTIGLHRMAYLAFNDPKRFSPDRMLVVVFNDALARYISRVLPSLGVAGVQVITYTNWAARQRQRHVPHMPREYSEETPPVVTRLKKHPMMLQIIDERVAEESETLGAAIEKSIRGTSAETTAHSAWKSFERLTPLQRVSGMTQWLRGEREAGGQRGDKLPTDTRLALGAALDRARERARDIVWDWAEMLTDREAMRDAVVRFAPGSFTDEEISQAVRYCSQRVAEMVINRHDDEDDDGKSADARTEARESEASASDREEALQELEPAERPRSNESRSRRDGGDEDADDDLDEVNPYLAVDGVDEGEKVRALLDPEDDALLLRLFQRKRGPLRRDKKLALLFEHIFVDEAQDLSPVELAVLLDTATPAKSVTLAGDTAQRLLLDNGFTDWKQVLTELGLQSVNVEPLKIGYRSTAEVLTFARDVLGPLADPEPPIATRSGAQVEMHRFSDTGAAVAFLGESLRDLALNEPRASVCVIAREPERADLYFEGLRRSEVPRLSRVRQQDFSFKAGVEVTDIRQVKGLEFDYVILVDTTVSQYPVNDESRHLLHIGATRAAHQLWLVASGEPSRLLPDALRL